MTCKLCGKSIERGYTYCSQDCFYRRGEIGLDEMFDFIVSYKRKHDGNSPTIRILAKELGYSSTSLVFDRLSKLEDAGKIRVGGGKARSIEVIGGEYVSPKR